MDIKQYISSGIIEQYVLGMASPADAAEFERLCKDYPELQKARIEFEMSLEKNALADSITPPPHLKGKILESLSAESAVNTAHKILHGENSANWMKKTQATRWAIAACIVVALGLGAYVFVLNNRNQKLEEDIAKTKERLDQIDQQKTVFEASILPESSVPKQVNVTMPETVPASINVFWDSTNKHVYLVIRNLTPLPANEKYQVWSITKGKSKSMGLFDAPADDKLILRLNDAQDAEAFGISIARLDNR